MFLLQWSNTQRILNTDRVKRFFLCDIGLKQLNLVANKPKHSLGNIERQKCSLVRSKEENVLLRKMMLITAEPGQNQAIVHRVLQQDYPKLRLLLETFQSVKPHVKWEIVGTQMWFYRPEEMIQISACYFVVCWKSGRNQLLRNFTSMRCAARALWAQFELLLLQQRVFYIKSAAHTTQA